MRAAISHSNVKEGAFVSLPSSKSLSHRALITAALSEGVSRIKGIAISKDIEATIRVMEQLGASFDVQDHLITVTGAAGCLKVPDDVMDCGESGSTLRFMIPVAAMLNKVVRFTGHGKLMERPQTVYEDLFAQQSLLFERDGSCLCLKGPLHGGHFNLRGDISSQFFSGLLFALPLCSEDSTIEILPPFESRAYVTLTIEALRKAGVKAQLDGNTLHIPGNQTYRCFDTVVEGDDSQMAFFVELALVHRSTVTIANISHDSLQADHVIVDLARLAGASVEETENGYTIRAENPRAITADLSDCPDLGPALFAMATQLEGTSVFTGCGRLRIKESDRIECMEEELRKLGCDITSKGDTVTVKGPTRLNNNVVLHGHNDHRIVMALSTLASISDGCIMEDAQAVTKSYPHFFEDFAACGMECECHD